MTLTGRTQYRVGMLGKIILQVEYAYRYLPAGCRSRAKVTAFVLGYKAGNENTFRPEVI